MYRNKHLFPFTSLFSRDVGCSWSEHELLVNCFIESGVAWSTGVQAIEPLGKRIFDFDMMSFDFALQPKG